MVCIFLSLVEEPKKQKKNKNIRLRNMVPVTMHGGLVYLENRQVGRKDIWTHSKYNYGLWYNVGPPKPPSYNLGYNPI